MKVCPKCGYRDPPEWRNLHFQLYTEYMEMEEFERLYPDLAERLKSNPYLVQDQHNAYHLTKAGYVHRVPNELIFNRKWYHGSNTTEKPKKPSTFKDPHKQLL